mgnify:CR=1 FL=1
MHYQGHPSFCRLPENPRRPDYLSTQEGRLLPVEHCIEGTHGWRLDDIIATAISHAAIDAGKSVSVFQKDTFGSVELGDYLVELSARMKQRIEEIVFVGLCTDICVISNALLVKAFLPETKITVDAACCAGVTPASHNNALAAMKACQINVENWEV